MIVRGYYDGPDYIAYRLGTIDDIELDINDFNPGKYDDLISASPKIIYEGYLSESGLDKLHKYYPNWNWKDSYTYLHVVSETELINEAEEKWRHEYYMRIVEDALRNNKPITNITQFRKLTDKFPITAEYLEHYGWEQKEDPIIKSISDEDKKQLNSEGIKYNWKEYTFVARNKDANDNTGYWFLTMRYELSNTVGRDWSCHIDNSLHESVGCVDIGTIEQFNKYMDLMDIEYRL